MRLTKHKIKYSVIILLLPLILLFIIIFHENSSPKELHLTHRDELINMTLINEFNNIRHSWTDNKNYSLPFSSPPMFIIEPDLSKIDYSNYLKNISSIHPIIMCFSLDKEIVLIRTRFNGTLLFRSDSEELNRYFAFVYSNYSFTKHINIPGIFYSKRTSKVTIPKFLHLVEWCNDRTIRKFNFQTVTDK